MALSRWMIPQMMGSRKRWPNLRSGQRIKEEDLFGSFVKLDPQECLKKLLDKFCEQEQDEKILLNYLNTFVKILLHYGSQFVDVNFNRQEILICLRLNLMHGSSIIRSAGMRCIRHLIESELDVVNMNNLMIPYLISRSLDLKHDIERIEAMKLTRKIITVSPARFDISMARSLVSLANETTEGRDRLLRISLATLLEIGLVNPNLFIDSGGVAAITRNLIDCQNPKIAESLCGILLLLLDRPETRDKANVDLHTIAAPFCDFHYKHGWKDKSRDERKLRLNCSRLALLTILKSWPGVLHFCNPKDITGFRAIVDVLYLNQREVRKAVLDLLYDLLGLQQPEWTDELSVALSAIDPCEPQSSWRLKEDFIVAEGRSVLPHLAKTTPSPTEMHLALLLFCFLDMGLLGALTEVITNSDTFISVRATVLLSELLRLLQLYLPPGCCNVSPSLPMLVDYATRSKPQAMAAITALQQLHKLMQKRPASYSLHLDYIIKNGASRRMKQKQQRLIKNKGLKSKLHQVKAVLKDGEDLVKETGVLSSNEVKMWNWSQIKIILKGERELDLSDSSHRMFLKRLQDFFTPSRNKYSHMDLGTTPWDSLELTTSGIAFIRYLGDVKDVECQTMVVDLFKDIHGQIKSISTSRSVHDCLFSPAHMINTHCQSYFLFIGQFARSEHGRAILDGVKMFTLLQELATTTRHDYYVKLIISSLDYSIPGPAREILDAVLTCDVESSRLYATQFLLILLRAGYASFATWAIRLLVRQLEDKSRKVYLSALSTLQEACELPDCLETLTDIGVDFAKFGEKGELLAIRILSTEKGFKRLGEDKVLDVIGRWDGIMNYRYVKIVENDILDGLTLHQRNEDGKYDKRLSNVGTKGYRKDIYLPPHLYGQLNQHAEGFQMLTGKGSIKTMMEILEKSECSTETQILHLKSSLWAIGHLSTSIIAFKYLNSLEFVSHMVRIATRCAVYGVRCTAFYALGLVGTTSLGADELCLNGWLATRHNRHEQWPVLQDELMDSLYMSYFASSVWDEGGEQENQDASIKEEDEVTLSEEDERLIEYPTSPSFSPDIRKAKQSTLPSATRTPPDAFHRRTMSESKTFDISNGYECIGPYEHIMMRQRNSSMTESTTSGVSSCDSLPYKQGGGAAYLQTLSPIPSSTSLSVLRLPNQIERHSHRVSSNSAGSEASTSSFSGTNVNELSLHDMLGYQTIRYIRRGDSLNFHRTEREDYLFKPPPQTSRQSELASSEPSATIHYSNFCQKFQSIYEPSRSYKSKDAVYRGISLPKVVTDIFPETLSKFPPHQLQDPPSLTNITLNAASESWTHSTKCCFYCRHASPIVENFFKEPIKMEILSIAERLANPVLSKPFKNQLLRLKQIDPMMFKDICVYSNVCKMFSESSYGLSTRRILHEVFLDVDYEKCFDGPKKMLAGPGKRRSVGEVISPNADFKTLDSLKLISAENKFPIRTRNNTN